MSYSFSTEVPADADKNTTEAKVQQAFLDGVPEDSDQRANAAEIARVAADAVYILKAKLGRPGDAIGVSISGHANADCEPVKGWSDCAISISLSQRVPKG